MCWISLFQYIKAKDRSKYKTYSWYRRRKFLSKLDIKGIFLILTNGTNEKSTTFIVPNVFSTIGIYTWLPTLTTFIQLLLLLKDLDMTITEEKRKKINMDGNAIS